MKHGVFGLGLLAVAGAFFGCSGSTQPVAPAAPSAGSSGMSEVDAGGASAAGAGPISGCSLDADCTVGVCDANQHACVECRVDATCADGERCRDGHCVNATPCAVGSYRCDGHALFRCSAEAELEFDRECDKAEYCDERRAQCQAQVCKPGAKSCDGGNVLVCNDEGSEREPKQLCSLTQTCSAGECLDIGCVPNTTFCEAGSVWKCGPDGTSSAFTEHCAASQYCLEKNGSASCNATACFAGDPLCVGNVATQCTPDGSGPKPGGTDCSASQQTCVAGECRDPVCTPGLKLCDKNSLFRCTQAGTEKLLLEDCGDGAACDLTAGACRPRICEAGKLGCDSTRVVTCNPTGTGWLQLGPNCATSNALCQAGACKPIICTPGKYVCIGNDVGVCSTDGTSVTSYNTCNAPYYHCVDSGGYYGASCSSYFCTPSAVGCNGNLLTTCKADGSAWATGGTDCTQSNGVCLNAQCKPKICTPSSKFCSGGSVQQCDYQGVSSYQTETCGYGSYCTNVGNVPDCAPTFCAPDTDSSCAAEKFGHCAPDGLSVTGATDCGALGKVCTAQGCATSAVDTIVTPISVGSNNNSSNYALLDVLEAHASRKLTTIEMFLSLPASRTLTWLVFQRNAVTGNFDIKYQKVTTATGSGFQSSGPMTFNLEAGKGYAIGVSVAGGGYAYYYDSISSPQVLSFAGVSGSISSSYGNTVGSYYTTYTIYHQRLTTTSP